MPPLHQPVQDHANPRPTATVLTDCISASWPMPPRPVPPHPKSVLTTVAAPAPGTQNEQPALGRWATWKEVTPMRQIRISKRHTRSAGGQQEPLRLDPRD